MDGLTQGPQQGLATMTAKEVMASLWDSENIGGDESFFSGLLDPGMPGKITRNGPYGMLLLLKQKPVVYKSFLGMILSGVQLRDACGSFGMHYNTVERIIIAGRQFYAQGTDHVAARFYVDILKARSQARGVAQMQVKKVRPLEWLKSDAGYKNFGEGEAPAQQLEALVDVVDRDDNTFDEEGSVTSAAAIAEVFKKLSEVQALPPLDVLTKQALAQEGFHVEEETGPASNP